MSVQVLVVGSGGREHALVWKLTQSPHVTQVFVAPGNGGTQFMSKTSNISLNVKDHDALGEWCLQNNISLVVIGPEDPLADGIVDVLTRKGIACFGPTAAAAQIEASKLFAKEFMQRHNIPTARYESFTDADEACNYISSSSCEAHVVKASGLAAGKGVIVATTRKDACDAARNMLQDKVFGAAGSTVVIEELLIGEEVSCLAFCDGVTVACFPPAQDHKRLLDNDEGPNTGGMGAYCPCPMVSEQQMEVIRRDVLQRLVDSMKAEGTPYVGVLYAGLMLTEEGPKVLEFNCRFGDPETQVLLPLLKSDLYEVMHSCVTGRLSSCLPQFHQDMVAVAVVAVIGGYPGSYKKGLPILGLSKLREEPGLLVFHAGTKLSGSKVNTSGGRVLAVVATDADIRTAVRRAQHGISMVQFEGKFVRSDIGHKAIKQCMTVTYSDSGVDIAAGDMLVGSIKSVVATTARPGCTSEIGMFGGVFDLKASGYRDPLLVSGTDGVGTKLKVAQACKSHSTVGIDLVAMCVNDVLCHGAEPLFFLDYFACGKLDMRAAKTVIEGIAEGCKMAGCTLLGGETAEMPGMYELGKYDLAGFAVGAVERLNYLPCVTSIQAGDDVIGLASSGIHSNGFSLVRHLLDRFRFSYTSPCPFDPSQQIGEAMLVPTKIYVKALMPILHAGGKVKALAHITGGGLPGNVSRVLPKGLAVKLNANNWRIPTVFGWLASLGNVEPMEMLRTFNCGIGMVLIVAASQSESIVEQLEEVGEEACVIGSVVPCDMCKGQVEVLNLAAALEKAYTPPSQATTLAMVNGTSLHTVVPAKKRVAVLISGTGTNLQALIDYTKNHIHASTADLVLVISNKPNVMGLTRAKAAGIPSQVISHKNYPSREAFDEALHEALTAANVDVICLAGFMRILSGSFVKKWRGRVLNIHPSLLPSFRGVDVHKRVLDAGVKLSGCTVHFVSEELDAGAIVAQEAAPVHPTDTPESLAERVKTVEHSAYPRALELVTSGRAVLLKAVEGQSDTIQWN